MDQKTQEWLQWRGKGIGSSDAPIILGVSPWATPYQLWEQKTGRVKKEQTTNFAIERGNRLEPAARADYELRSNMSMPALLVEHKQYPFLRASMDGFNLDQMVGLEIKCPGAADHALAKQGKVPEKYYAQVQHQILVTGANWIDYYSYDGERGVSVRVYPDIEYCKKLLAAEIAFWDMVCTDKEPALIDRDWHQIRSVDFKTAAARFRDLNEQAKKIDDELEELKVRMKSLVGDHARSTGYGIQIIKSSRKGNVDYSKIPELQGVDLEQYRKPFSATVTLKVVKEKKDDNAVPGSD